MKLTPQRGIATIAALIVLALTLLVLTIGQLGGRVSKPKPLKGREGVEVSIPTDRILRLFTSTRLSESLPKPTDSSLFQTTFYQPPPPKPPPKAPTTRKITLVFSGFTQTSGAPPQAFIQGPDGLVVRHPGSKVAGDLILVAINGNTLTLTNASGQTNLLPFKVAQEVSVPIQ